MKNNNKVGALFCLFIAFPVSAASVVYDGNNNPAGWQYDSTLACIYTQQTATIPLSDAIAITELDFCSQDPQCSLDNEILSCSNAYDGGIRSITYTTNADEPGDPPNDPPDDDDTSQPASDSATGLHPLLEAVSTNEWQLIQEYNSGPPFAVTAWSGGAGNRYYAFVYGGGHNDTDYNGLWRLDHQTLAFEEYIPAGSGPLSVHTYDGVTLHTGPQGIEFCTGGGSSFPFGDSLQSITCTSANQPGWYDVYDDTPLYNSVGDFAMVSDKTELGVFWIYRGAVGVSPKGLYKFYRYTNQFEFIAPVSEQLPMDEGWIEDCGDELLVGRAANYQRYSKQGVLLGAGDSGGGDYAGRECVNGNLYVSPDFYQFTYGRFYYIGEGLFGMIVPIESGWQFWAAKLF